MDTRSCCWPATQIGAVESGGQAMAQPGAFVPKIELQRGPCQLGGNRLPWHRRQGQDGEGERGPVRPGLRQFRGELFSSFYPGKAALHPSLEVPSHGPFPAEEFIKSLQEDGPLTPRIDKLGYTVTPRQDLRTEARGSRGLLSSRGVAERTLCRRPVGRPKRILLRLVSGGNLPHGG